MKDLDTRFSLLRRCAFGLFLALLTSPAQAQFCTTGTELTQSFPSAGPAVSRWHLCWNIERMPDEGGALTQSETLVIRQAEFRPGASAADVRVIGDARVAEIFVPYHHTPEDRFHDLTDFSFDFQALTALECPGTRLDGDRLCVEVKDRGLAWRDPFGGTARRGEELALWGIMNAGNYDYIMEWTFLDDGAIHGRVGMTGPKLEGEDDPEGHMHNFAWRLNLDIDGFYGDRTFLSSHRERGTSGIDTEIELPYERGIKWIPKKFNHLKIEDQTRTNARGRKTAYELSPSREGLAKHVEPWTRFPFWITRAHGATAEMRARDLPSYVNGELVANNDVVIWYIDGHHHEDDMRDEDRDTVPTEWLGFRLEPQNMWDRTPFYP